MNFVPLPRAFQTAQIPNPLLARHLMWLGPQILLSEPRRGEKEELTLGVSADESGEISKECERGEVSQVSDLQGVQQGAEALSTEPEKRWGQAMCFPSHWALLEASLSRCHVRHPELHSGLKYRQ